MSDSNDQGSTNPLGDACSSPNRLNPVSTSTSPFPSPVRTAPHRIRTDSWSRRVTEREVSRGIVKEFCRQKGHGFVTPADGGPDLFCHVSDIDGDYVPKAGDEVTFKKMPIPPKNIKFEAVHVNIVRMAPGTEHETWEAALTSQSAGDVH